MYAYNTQRKLIPNGNVICLTLYVMTTRQHVVFINKAIKTKPSRQDCGNFNFFVSNATKRNRSFFLDTDKFT